MLPRRRSTHADLVVFGGIGLHKPIFSDLLLFNMGSHNWRAAEVGSG